MIKLPLRNGIQQILEGLCRPFEIFYTTQSTKIKTDQFTYIGANKHLAPSHLGFLNQVKRYAEKIQCNDPEVLAATSSNIKYFHFSRIWPGVYEGYTELDVNGAYWQIALQKGYISPELYEKGLSLPKIVRLVALGAMASTKSHHRFDGVAYKYVGDICNDTTRAFFFDVARTLDDLMQEATREHAADILFYWVDAFFVRAEAKDAIVKAFDAAGLGLKEKAITRIVVEEKPTHLLVRCQMEDGEEKPFIYVPEKNRAQFNINRHNDTVARAKKLGII